MSALDDRLFKFRSKASQRKLKAGVYVKPTNKIVKLMLDGPS